MKTIEFGDVMLGTFPQKLLYLVNNSIYDIEYRLFIIDGISPEFNENGKQMLSHYPLNVFFVIY